MLIKRRLPEVRSRQSGVSAIEFAILLPFMLVFLYGVLSYSVIFMYQLSLNAMAAESARAAVVAYSTNYNNREQEVSERIDAVVGSAWIPQQIGGCGTGGQKFSSDSGLLTVCLAVTLPIRPMQLGGLRLPDVNNPLTAQASVSIHE